MPKYQLLFPGFSITSEEIDTHVSEHVASAPISGWANLSSTINQLKSTSALRWANPLELKAAVEREFTKVFGEKSAAAAKAKVCFTGK